MEVALQIEILIIVSSFGNREPAPRPDCQTLGPDICDRWGGCAIHTGGLDMTRVEPLSCGELLMLRNQDVERDVVCIDPSC